MMKLLPVLHGLPQKESRLDMLDKQSTPGSAPTPWLTIAPTSWSQLFSSYSNCQPTIPTRSSYAGFVCVVHTDPETFENDSKSVGLCQLI